MLRRWKEGGRKEEKKGRKEKGRKGGKKEGKEQGRKKDGKQRGREEEKRNVTVGKYLKFIKWTNVYLGKQVHT